MGIFNALYEGRFPFQEGAMDLLRELKGMPVTLHLLQVSSSSPGLGWFQRQQFQEQGFLYDSHKA